MEDCPIMSLISTSQLSKSYDPVDIFEDITISIPKRARIALVGPNGIGKTTLLRILVGLEEPSSGTVHRSRNLSIGYLPQEAVFDSANTLWEECLEAFNDLLDQAAELARLEKAMSDPEQASQALERYGSLQRAFEVQGGYTYEDLIRQTLRGLGFQPDDENRPLSQLSGGQRTRALLAHLLLSKPELLVLDEPTNHLDMQAVEWLEGYLSKWEGATLIVSHDRYFLDQVVDHIWEMNLQSLETYRGNYSAYLHQRQERWVLRQQLFESEKERLEKELDYIRRNIAGQNTIQAKGRLRRLSRYLGAISKSGLQAIQDKKWSEISDKTGAKSQVMSLEEATAHIKSLRNPVLQPPKLKMNLKTVKRSGDLVLRTHDLSIGYADENEALFQVPDLVLKRGECAALIGPNGAGKTTFLKTLLGKIPPFAGGIILGASLDVGYFAQAHEDLDPQKTLLAEIDALAPHLLEGQIRDYLARFLFTGGDVYKTISTLSGGERGRLALAKLALSNANLLLLDEPTNHLDIPSQEILQDVMAEYSGTILLVSHDRYLIDALGTQIWEIQPDQSSMRVFQGTYSEYHLFKENEKITREGLSDKKYQPRQKPANRTSGEEKRRRAYLAALEDQITSLEQKLAILARKLENPPTEPSKIQRMGVEYVEIQNEINTLVAEWEGLHTEKND
jgi:ATP-binding cassette subfamily F protein 3